MKAGSARKALLWLILLVSISAWGADAPVQADGNSLPGSDKVSKGHNLKDCLRARLRGEELDEECKKLLSAVQSPGAGAARQGSSGGLQSGQTPPDVAKALEEAIRHSHTNYAAAYKDYEGEFVLDAKGDRGGFVKLILRFDGFYLRPVLTLTQAKQGTIALSPGSDYKDFYQIIPRQVSASLAMDMSRHCVNPDHTIYGHFTADFSDTFENQPPPNYESQDLSIPQWINAAKSGFLGDKLRFSLAVESRQAAGGDAWLKIDANAMFQGILEKSRGSRPQGGRISFYQNDSPGKGHLSFRTGHVSWGLPSLVKLPAGFSMTDISMSCTGSEQATVEHCPSDAYTQESDRQWHISYRLTIRAKMNVEATLAAVDQDSASYQPVPDDVRTFRLTLKSPGPEQVEAVRFKLEDVSSHPGVATNAGNHMLYGQCQDCSLNKEPEITYVSTSFAHQDGGTYAIRRACTHYNDCPIDSLPDLFFSERANRGFDLSDGGTKNQLQYTISQTAKLRPVENNSVDVKVTVKDGAASGKLKAEVQVAGVWYPARAKGPCADSNGDYLSLPLDNNDNGIADAWEKLWKVSDPDADDDSLPNNPNVGDGLTVFEEYRGIYWRGNHHRMSPARKDVFVYDYSKAFSAPLSSLLHLFSAQQIDLWPIRDDEHKEEVVNYHQGGQHKKGDEYAIVVMALSQCPGLDFGRAQGKAYVSPPTARYNTVVMKEAYTNPLTQVLGNSPNQSLTATLGHEIGHNMSIVHHGEGDGYRKLGGQDAYIACRHGLYSGQLNCFMKYNCANYFLDMDFVPQSSIVQFLTQGLLQPFPASECGQQDCFCQSNKGSGVCGDARQGNCLGQVNVKSY